MLIHQLCRYETGKGFEQGKWRNVEPGKLIALADALGCSLDELAGRNGQD